MSNSSIGLSDSLQQYLLDISLVEPDCCLKLREETAKLPEAQMISSPEQVQLITLLAKLINARKGLEIGTFTGYSSLCLTLALPQLEMTCCDISENFTSIGQRHWRDNAVDDRILLKLAPAIETLEALVESGQSKSFDFAYIDADKTGYRRYVELCFKLIRSKGIIAIDNVLWSGSVINSSDQTEDTVALRQLNSWLHDNAGDQYELSVIPIGDGLTLLFLK
jgi:predicted O-methyltransferase YrrM